MTHCIRLLIAAGTAGVLLTAGQVKPQDAAPPRVLTVCEVLSAALKYDGRVVKIRGRVEGTSEGAWLIGDDCPGVFVAEGHVWGSNISLEMPTMPAPLRLHQVDFKYDWDSESRTEAKYSALEKSVPHDCLAFTYTGMFETRTDWSHAKAVYPNGTWKYIGFGHLGGSPGQLLLKSEDDVEAVPGCTDKSSPPEGMGKK
ncbi:MAG: hypothetical protein ABSE42_11765 [Bryobacteraceae bacterium]|jgi:hypothetical protein